jgi:hypothetical protein
MSADERCLQMRKCVRVLLACLAIAACGDDQDDPAPNEPMDGSVPDGGGPDGKVELDAKVDGSRDAGPEAGCGLPATYSFHFDGGLSPGGDWSYTVHGSSLQKTKRSSAMADAGAITCTTLLGCGVPNVVDGDELGRIFFPADVAAAFTTADVVLGLDTRPVDGQVLVIEDKDGKKLQIGAPCGSAPSCTPIPANLETLRATLVKLIDENKPQAASVDGGSGADACNPS